MAVNLVGSVGRVRARELLESSFAQFQADRSVVGLARQVQRNVEALDGYGEAMTCHLGDFTEYAQLRASIKKREAALSRTGAAQRRAATAESLDKLRPGDVIRVTQGRRAGLAVVVDPGTQALGDSRPLVVTEDRWAGRLSLADFTDTVEPVSRVRVPRNFNPRSPQMRRDLASTLRNVHDDVDRPSRRRSRSAAADDPELAELRAAMRRHPAHGCDDREDHARWAERHLRLQRDTDVLRERVASRTGSLARTFDKVCRLLERRGYLTPEPEAVPEGDVDVRGAVTPAGRRLARIWSESDLLVAECLRTGVWDSLGPAELAGAVSAVVYEGRRVDDDSAAMPRGPLADALGQALRLWQDLESEEAEQGLSLTREPDFGFVWPVYRWARGESLERVLRSASGLEGELSAGDFVRWSRQVVDLLDQIAGAADDGSTLRATARAAVDAVRRGVVAQSALS
jgi:ATP-dependent RNA helicase HelY